jgi:glutaminyl-peptide cyclotransferase
MVAMRNYIVRYPGKKDGVIVLATHYETNYPLKDINFVGANDGACTTALLIEIGHYLRTHPPEGFSVWLVFDDGEEAIKEWSDSDSLYGTRHLAAKWSKDGTLPKIKAFLLADMIGDKDLNIDRDSNSTPWLLSMLATAAKNTGHSNYVFKNETTVNDDHLPFKQRNVPVLDLIDIDYGPHTNQTPDGYHHTAQDTMDKISAKSLQTSADIFLEMIHQINLHRVVLATTHASIDRDGSYPAKPLDRISCAHRRAAGDRACVLAVAWAGQSAIHLVCRNHPVGSCGNRLRRLHLLYNRQRQRGPVSRELCH